jgi:hypothetical protein
VSTSCSLIKPSSQAASVAERLGLPFVTAILTLPFNRYPSVPFCCYHDTINRGIVARQKRLGQCAGSSAGCQ